MANFGHVKRYTTIMNGGEITFRSLFEYRYAVYLELLREQGHIQDWVYEDKEFELEFKHGRYGNTRKYIPDFAVLNLKDEWEVHETKGYFPPIDYTKIKAHVTERGNPFVLIFGRLKDGSKNAKSRAQYNRAKRLEPHIEATGGRIIWEAEKDLLRPIKHLFEI